MTFESSGRHSGVSQRLMLPRLRLVGGLVVSLLIGVSSFVSVSDATASTPIAPLSRAPYVDEQGWTVFSPSADTRKIYVSNSTGNDSNTGLSEATPVKTLAKGASLLRTGYPDWLLLKKGDIWTDETIGMLLRSGRSSDEPMLISSYGMGSRPRIQTASVGIGSINGIGGDYLAIVGIEFYNYKRDPNNPAFDPTVASKSSSFMNSFNWLLLEDNKLSYVPVVIQPIYGTKTGHTVIVRRNIVSDNYVAGSATAGMFVKDVIGSFLLEENIFDHNGWNELVPGATRNKYSRNFYYQTSNVPITAKGNIFARGASEGAQFRSGGTIYNNLFIANAIGFDATYSNPDYPQWTVAQVSKNIVVYSTDISSSETRGWGIVSYYATGSGVQITDNIVAHSKSAYSPAVIGIGTNTTTGITISNNILCNLQGTPKVINDLGVGDVVTGNMVNANTCDGLGSYSNRTVETYDRDVLGGPGTLEHFYMLMRQQNKDSWNPKVTASAVNDYLRAGFAPGSGSGGGGSTPTPDITAPSTPSGLEAVASSNQIRLSWAPSTDNVGVAGYTVFRDGVKIGTTTSPSYDDSNVNSGMAYTYTVSAYDAAGNSSSQSASAAASTLGEFKVAVVTPSSGTVVKGNGNLSISATATDDGTGVRSISIMFNGILLNTCHNVASCGVIWSGKNVSQGTHVITAISTSNGGNQANASSSITALR